MSKLQAEKNKRQEYYLQLMGIPVWKLERQQQSSTISFTLKKKPEQEKTSIAPEAAAQQGQNPVVAKDDVIAPVLEAESLTPELESPPSIAIDDMASSFAVDQANPSEVYPQTIAADIGASQEISDEPSLVDIKSFHAETALEQQIAQLNQAIPSCQQCESRLCPEQSITGRFLSISEQQSSLLVLLSEPSELDFIRKQLLAEDYLQLFNTMLRAMGVDKRSIYITSLLKCYSRKHQKPSHTERENCFAFLKQELAIINPSVIMTLGSIDLSDIINETEQEDFAKEDEKAEGEKTLPLSALRQKRLTLANTLAAGKTIPVVATFHPAFLYRNPLFKKQAFEDLLSIKKLLK